ncbi:energy-coupling factor transporter ATPase [[Mycoplasma] mobile]|uniref:Energy-coupling factor transporter ATP-binding protein EcfA2 n=1 Tax=Mycoplasma mobile (strain ATCC 43663 / 163K / NCTC 11711) TaxID=267748 RepID=ECFA2_MYCM1|nr:energy-coupling factor transporter ATPase [[Mycoplasma] mobile]Q6KHL2.1 RecName: Full=Energy-coupling factor transporter ATP-binding protein EcfA2; Short=ECF transporter A component EcfA2 [Mycoplasma mobile 163K]AAT27918.1 putative ABC transporter ATPase component [Mycoplasma mobile 163K]
MQIEVKNISKVFEPKSPIEFTALKGVSLSFEQGEFISIIGPTGSGKTTFIEHLNALNLPSIGSIVIKGKFKDQKDKKNPVLIESEVILQKTKRKIKQIKEIRRQIGIVFQFAEYQLFESTIEKDIAFGPISLGISKEEAYKRAKKYISIVGLPENYLQRSPFELSGGQKRRVALAGILAMDPDFLIFDEPTAGLDPQGSKEILEIFGKLNSEGKTVIIVTHNLDHALEWTNRTIFFNDGFVIKDGKTYDVLEDVDFLRENEMEPPKLLVLKKLLQDKGINLSKVRSIEDFAREINQYLETKNKTKENN